MEKFRKFDDPRFGVNAFVPLKETTRSLPVQFLRSVSQFAFPCVDSFELF